MGLITLLDDKEYDIDKLLKRMEDDDFYYGELSNLALSSSAIKLLYESPKKYHYVKKYGGGSTQGLRDGWLLHCLLLEPEKFNEQIFVDVQSKNSKAYKLAVEEHGTVYTAKERSDAERLADAVLKNEQALRLMSDCEYEVPVIGEVMGMPFRGKADVLCNNAITDIKTTNDIKGFPYSSYKWGYDIQVFLYCELFNVPYSEFRFLVIDKGTLDIAIYDCDESFYMQGASKVEKAIDAYVTYFMQQEIDVNDYVIKGTLKGK